MSKLGLNAETIARARESAARVVEPVQRLIDGRTTVSVERATLRLLGADGVNADGVPVPNLVTDTLAGHLHRGAARVWIAALLERDESPRELSLAVADGLKLGVADRPKLADDEASPTVAGGPNPAATPEFAPRAMEAKATELLARAHQRVSSQAAYRDQRISARVPHGNSPLLYVIVATGSIHEDVKQACVAAEQGADVIAVIRTTAQSLLDYVPHGATTEGCGGTWATQENFRIMRQALDEMSEQLQRYIRLVNYASGLCMPEIAAMGALERVDMMLNDSMYGILFRDINMGRTFVDQHFSRRIQAWAGMAINTGEDNYLTTADAVERAFTVLASQFLNERFALEAGLPAQLQGLGHAFEIDPDIEDGFLLELAQAQMAREIFPDAPLKYMPPTRHMTGDIFRGVAMNTLFSLVSQATHQGIHLLGMLTEAVHTPFVADRSLAIANARHVMKAAASLGDEIEFREDGIIRRRARQVLDEAVEFLQRLEQQGLFQAIEAGEFADMSRTPDGGKGAEGVLKKAPDYWNPLELFLDRQFSAGAAVCTGVPVMVQLEVKR